jgi:hypothetical protein
MKKQILFFNFHIFSNKEVIEEYKLKKMKKINRKNIIFVGINNDG